MRRRWSGLVGLVLVGLGLAVVGLNIRPSFDPVVLTMTRNHGIHLSDLVGSAVAFAGTWFVWHRG